VPVDDYAVEPAVLQRVEHLLAVFHDRNVVSRALEHLLDHEPVGRVVLRHQDSAPGGAPPARASADRNDRFGKRQVFLGHRAVHDVEEPALVDRRIQEARVAGLEQGVARAPAHARVDQDKHRRAEREFRAHRGR
jgi:hypothetical protein